MKWKKFHFKKKYKCGIKAPIKCHTCIFFWNEHFFISKKFTSVESATCNFFLEKVWDIAKFRKKSRKKWLSPDLTLRKYLYMDRAMMGILNFEFYILFSVWFASVWNIIWIRRPENSLTKQNSNSWLLSLLARLTLPQQKVTLLS